MRSSLRQSRFSLAPHAREHANEIINQVLVDAPEILKVNQVAAFLAFDGEPDISPAMHIMVQRAQVVCLPVVESRTRISMARWTPDTIMSPNRFGIPEPAQPQRTPLASPLAVLVPLVGWDQYGHRLGMGSGYYDRFLERVSTLEHVITIGIAYQSQRVEKVPVEEHDVPLDALVSENGWTQFTH